MTDLEAIVARDAEWAEQPDGSLAYTWINVRSGEPRIAPHATDPDGPADRRALLALLRETRDALVDVGECHGCISYGNESAAELLERLAVLDPEPIYG